MRKVALSGNKGDGLFALIDDDDFEKVGRYNWNLSSSGYATRKQLVKGSKRPHRKYKRFFMHRVVLDIVSLPKGFAVDHINGNPLDNRRENLRICTHAQNSRNRGKNKNGKSKYKGVFSIKTKNLVLWVSAIGINYKRIYLGCYKTSEEAALAYNKKATELYGEFAKLNVLP